MSLKDDVDNACAVLLVELAWLVPRGSNMLEHSAGKALTRYVDLVRAEERARHLEDAHATALALITVMRELEALDRAICDLRSAFTPEILEALPVAKRAVLDQALVEGRRALREAKR